MPRGRKKKSTSGLSLDFAVVVMFILSIILGLLIYRSDSGWIGQNLTPILGGILGVIKYVLPIAVFTIAIYLISNKRVSFIKTYTIQYIFGGNSNSFLYSGRY